MLWDLPTGWLIALNIVGWPIIHLGVAYLITRIARERFDPRAWLFRERRFERGGALYERLFAVSRWKRRLPDGAALFARGFPKKRLSSKQPAYLRQFQRETCRAELAHWIMMGFGPLFFSFNPPIGGWVMITYAVVANLPFIVVQRHNRARLSRMLERVEVTTRRRPGAAATCACGAPAPSECASTR